MPYCKECGNKIDDSANFCPYCGSTVHLTDNSYTQRKQEYVGKVYKCPNCGQELKSFEVECPSCGYEIRGARATSSVQELARRIQQIEAGREYEKRPALFSLPNHLSKTDKQIINVIQSYPIPNTIEDILEMMILASSNIDMSSYNSFDGNRSYATRQISDAWKAKCEQAYLKAKMSFRDTSQFHEVENIYSRTNKMIKKEKRKVWVMLLGLWGIVIVIWIALFITIKVKRSNPNYAIDVRQNELERIERNIEEDIAAGKFEDARNKAYTLVFNEELSTEKSEYWHKQRESILSRINEAETASKK